MTYKTTKAVRDTQDNGFFYYAGATYPRKGLEVSKERLETLVKNEYKSSASKAELLALLEGGE